MKTRIAFLAAGAALLAAAGQASAQVTLYEAPGFHGRAFTADRPIGNLARFGFNDRASSAVVDHGRWEVCDDAHFRGRCVVLRRGSYDSLRRMGLDNRISSVRPLPREVGMAPPPPPPPPAPVYEYRPRPNERLFQAPVRDVHAVVGPPERRCWIERQQVAPAPGPNVGGAIVGGVLGAIIGHQIGGGSGRTAATIGGTVGGAALGANVDRFAPPTQDVRRCQTAPSGPPAYWDVSYEFRGVIHHVQMSAPPGPTITVNGAGEPRQ